MRDRVRKRTTSPEIEKLDPAVLRAQHGTNVKRSNEMTRVQECFLRFGLLSRYKERDSTTIYHNQADLVLVNPKDEDEIKDADLSKSAAAILVRGQVKRAG